MTIQKIKNRFKIIEREITYLVIYKYYFEKYQKYIKNSKNINKANSFLFFIENNYKILALIDVCKQVDDRSDVESLVNLLKDIKKLKNYLSSNWFIKKDPKWFQNFGLDIFKKFSTKNNKAISIEKINNDIKEIKKVINGLRFGKKRQSIESLTKYRHKRGAHFAKGNPKINISIKNLYKAIDLLEKMIIKYNILINQTGRDTLLPRNIDQFIKFHEIFRN